MKSYRYLFNSHVAKQTLLIAFIYAIITYAGEHFWLLSTDYEQFRFSEAMCILPAFLPASIPGLFIGCIAGNILCGCALWDIVLGSLATLVAAIFTAMLRKKSFLLYPLPAFVVNSIVIPLILPLSHRKFAYAHVWTYVKWVGLGEFICCYVLGLILYSVLRGTRRDMFMADRMGD